MKLQANDMSHPKSPRSDAWVETFAPRVPTKPANGRAIPARYAITA
jgi:hypothetical protein